MASNRNMNKIIRACYDLNQDWNKELNEMECELNHCREVAEEYINIKDQENAELKRELEEENRKRQEVEKEMENFKKHRKELLNVVMDIHYRHRHGSNLKMLEDHLHKLIVSMTNSYDTIPDIYEDLKTNYYRKERINELNYYIIRAQDRINDRIEDGRRGRVTKVNVTPTIHKVSFKDYWEREKMLKMIKYEFKSHYEDWQRTKRNQKSEVDEIWQKVHNMTRQKYNKRERRQIKMIQRNLALNPPRPRG